MCDAQDPADAKDSADVRDPVSVTGALAILDRALAALAATDAGSLPVSVRAQALRGGQ